MNRKNQDQIFTELLRKDQVGKPDQAIENRLMYSYLLKNSRSKMRQNSFSSFFGWIFSTQSLGLKTGLVSVILFFSLFNSQMTPESSRFIGSDSISSQRILLADSAHFTQTVDSIRKDSLY
jgi:hypothetical protein